MFNGRKGKKVLQKLVERFEKNGKDPWHYFSLDVTFIKAEFGQQAADWALAKKKAELHKFINQLREIQDFRKVVDE